MRRGAELALRITGAVLAGLALIAVIGVLVLTRTDWGRERVRAFGVGQLARQVAGNVRIETLSGNLLTGATLTGVNITDSAGAPFLRADTVKLSYSLRSFFSKHLVFTDVVLVHPEIVVDRPPGGEWNFVRLFPRDTSAADTVPGFGSWVRFEDVTVRDGTVFVRNAWSPPDTLGPAARERAIARATSPDGRLWVVPVEGGYQQLSLFHDVHARLPLVRIADPDSAARLVVVDSLRTIALPLRPPAAHVNHLEGRFVITRDTVLFREITATLPATRLAGEGFYQMDGGALEAEFRAGPLSFEDMRWVMPELPDGGGRLQAHVVQNPRATHVVARDVELTAEGARVAGHADVRMGDTLRLGASDVHFTGVDTRVLERLMRGSDLPVAGVASGHFALRGSPASLTLDGWAEFRERSGGVSRLVAEGVVGTEDGAFRARDLRLRLEPVRLSLARAVQPTLPWEGTVRGTARLTGSTRSAFDLSADLVHVSNTAGRSRVLADGAVVLTGDPAARNLRLRFTPLQVAALRPFLRDVPLDGTLSGRATINGAPATRMSAVLDVVHAAETGQSRVIGDAVIVPNGGPRFEVDLRMPVLSLATVGRFAPAAELQGSASGRLTAQGTAARFGFDTNLTLAQGGGVLRASGTVRQGARPAYDVSALLDSLNAAAASGRAPETALTGLITIQGEGTDPATMAANVRAELVDFRLDTTRVADTTHIAARIASGLLRVDSAHLRLASAAADVTGSFGLVEGTSGELRYNIAVDSLRDFSRYLPADTGAFAARPARQMQKIVLAREDSIRVVTETEVQRAALGYPLPPALEVDSIPPLKRDSVAGALRAEGTLTGNIHRFDAQAQMEAERLIVAGTALSSGRASLELQGFGTPDARFRVDAGADSVRVAGFAFDSADVNASYTGIRNRGRGTAELAVYQDPDRDYRLRSEFLLELDRRELTFNELVLRFDTVRWSAPSPGEVRWAGGAVTIDSVDLRSSAGGRILIDGRIPASQAGDLHVAIERLPIGQITALLQDTTTATGLLDLDTQLRGTAEAPTFEATTSLLDGTYGGRPIPDLRATLSYANRELQGRAELTEETTRLLQAEAELPINLAFRGVQGNRLLNEPLRVQLRADSLPLEALPSFTPAVEDVRGRVRGDVAVRGTYDDPALEGAVNLDLASLHVVEPNLNLREIAGTLRLTGNTLTLDSLVAWSGGGSVRAAGTVGVETLTQPSFDLTVDARDLLALDNRRGTVRGDADITVQGPFENVRVRGDINVREGVFYLPETGKKRITNLDDPLIASVVDTSRVMEGVLPRRSPLVDNLDVDVNLSIERNTWARNTDVNVEIYTPAEADALRVRLAQPTGNVGLEGIINAGRGEYRFSGRVFQLTAGSATFLPGSNTIDPLLQLSAQYAVPRRGRESLSIQIHVTGQLSDPRVALESNAQPPLPESDLLSFLAFGRASSSLLTEGSSLGGGSSGIEGLGLLAQQQLAGLAIGTMIDEAVTDLERQGTRAGLDVFRIHPGDLPEEAAFSGDFSNFLRGTEIVAGKYLGQSLFLGASGRTTAALPGVRIEYSTPGGFSWETTWEPRYLPVEPSLDAQQTAARTRALGTFFFWTRRF